MRGFLILGGWLFIGRGGWCRKRTKQASPVVAFQAIGREEREQREEGKD